MASNFVGVAVGCSKKLQGTAPVIKDRGTSYAMLSSRWERARVVHLVGVNTDLHRTCGSGGSCGKQLSQCRAFFSHQIMSPWMFDMSLGAGEEVNRSSGR